MRAADIRKRNRGIRFMCSSSLRTCYCTPPCRLHVPVTIHFRRQPDRRHVMKRTIFCVLSALLLGSAWPTAAFAQTGAAQPNAPQAAPAQNGPMPTVAFDITKADIDYVLKNAPANPPDRQLRVVDMGKYNLGVGIIHRGPTNDKPGDPISVIYHDFTPEVYIITAGSGVLTA